VLLMALLTKFFPYVTVDVVGAALPSVEVAVRDTCIDFCERTLILQADHDPITAIKGIPTYEFAPPDGYLVDKVMHMWFEGRLLWPVVTDSIQQSTYVERGDSTRAAPQAYMQKDSYTFTLLPTPDETKRNGIVMRVALKPTRDATVVDDVLFDTFGEVIGHGAKYRLLLSPGKEYSNPQLAEAYKAMFDSGMSRARARMGRNHTRANMSVRLNGGFA
jgi:hypothetical protein